MQGPANSESRQQEVSQISRGLKALAKELGVPVVALSQLSRAPEQRTGDNKRPQLSDLRESGAIEQDADLIMFLYRQEYLRRPDGQGRNSLEGKAGVIIGKQRNGPTGIVNLFFHKQYTRFENFTHARSSDRTASSARLTAPRTCPKVKTVYRCTECGAETPKWAGALRRLRRVEHARRGVARARRSRGRQRRAARRRRRGSRGRQRRRHAAARATSTGSESAALDDRHRRVRLRARRRHRARVDGARRRRAGHRQVDAAAPGRRAARGAPAAPTLYVSGEESRAAGASCAPTGSATARGDVDAPQRDRCSRRSSRPPRRASPPR